MEGGRICRHEIIIEEEDIEK